MSKSLLLTIVLLAMFTLAALGCAHQPPAPQVASLALAGRLNVMQMANDMGYNTPRVINGEVFYCQPEQMTGSLVPKLACLKADDVVAHAREEGDMIEYLKQPPNSVQRPEKPQRP